MDRYAARLRTAAAVLALSLTPFVTADGEARFRAFWADAFHSGFKSSAQINTMVSRAVTGNYNAIIAEVLAYHDTGAGGHGAYWNSSIVPKASDISPSFNPLAYLVSRAHLYDIEVHAWIVSYRVSTTWPPPGNSFLALHPEWLMVPSADIGGGPAKVDGKYTLDPGSPEVQEYLVGIVQELVSNYDIDGLNLDYIRYTSVDAGYPADEDYSLSSLARFRAWTGYTGTPAPSGVPTWNDFRRQTIDEFVRRLRVEIPSIPNPRQPLRLTADLITFGGAPSSFGGSDAYALFQNWEYWLRVGYLDAGIPMNYKREWFPPHDDWYRDWVDAAIGWRYERHVFCGQANYLNPKADSVTQLQYCLDAGADGTSNYSYVGTADEDMDGSWESDWTWYTYVSDHLFTEPVAPPPMPWRDPASATEGTLWGRVADPATDQAIDAAVVELDGDQTVRADGNGIYVITLIPAVPGGTTYNLTAQTYGCTPVEVTGVVVLPGEVVRQDIALCDTSIGAGDMDEDGDIDAGDLQLFSFCFQGPETTYPDGHFCLRGDANGDGSLDMADFTSFQLNFTGPL